LLKFNLLRQIFKEKSERMRFKAKNIHRISVRYFSKKVQTSIFKIHTVDFSALICYNIIINILEVYEMKHINTIQTRNLCESAKNGGCGECQTSCQSACKTSCGIANQACENKDEKQN